MRIGEVQMDGRWSGLSMVDRLANGDITKHKDIYELTYIECLNLLSFWNERDRFYDSMRQVQSGPSNGIRYAKN